jgi:hypothetical protein
MAAQEPLFIGRVYVWGLDGTLLHAGIAATTENEPQSLNYKDDVTRHVSKDKKGKTVGIQLYDDNPKVTIKYMPCSTATGAGTIAPAKTRVTIPSKGANVTLAGFPPNVGTAEDLINSTKWKYLGGAEIDFTNEAEVMITLPLETFIDDLAVNNS